MLFKQRRSCDRLSLSFAWVLSCAGSHFITSGWVVPPPPSRLTWPSWQLHKEREMFQRWSMWIIFPFEGHIADQTRAALHLIFLQSLCFCESLESSRLAKKVLPFLLSRTVFLSQAASKQSIYKKFWLLFFTLFLCQEGNMIDPWLELLCCCEPTKSTCPSRTIPSYSLVGFFLFFNECFCANRTRWLCCIVRCWSSSCSLVLLQFSKRKLPIVWSVDPSYRGAVVIGVQRKNRIRSQFAMLKRTSKQELENGISCGSNDTSVTDGLWGATKNLMCCSDFYCFQCSGLWY